MIGTVDTWLIIAGLLIVIDVVSVLVLAATRTKNNIDMQINAEQKKAFVSIVSGEKRSKLFKFESRQYLKMKKTIQLSRKTEEYIQEYANSAKIEKKLIKNLNAWGKTKRADAAFSLGRLKTEKARVALEHRLRKEKNFTVKLFVANAISDIKNPASLSVLIDSLMGSSRFYRQRVNMLIADFGKYFHDMLPSFSESEEEEIRELIMDFAEVYYSEYLKQYLIDLVLDNIESIEPESGYAGQRSFAHKACHVLAEYYPRELKSEIYLNAKDLEIRKCAVKGLSKYEDSDNADLLISMLSDPELSDCIIDSFATMIERNPVHLKRIANCFFDKACAAFKPPLAQILSLRIEYFILKLLNAEDEKNEAIIREVLVSGKTNGVIDFLNANQDENIEKKLMHIVKQAANQNGELEQELTSYLIPRLALQIGPLPEKQSKKSSPSKDKKYLTVLFFLLLCNFLLVPAIFLFVHRGIVFDLTLASALRLFVKDFNYYFAYYSISINVVYFSLLFFSFIHVRQQEKMWTIKDLDFLFKRKMLPSVSIIAPAYNEAKTIIENVNSLLNLKYPDDEVVVVNDGSSDETLQNLIKEFHLKRTARLYKKTISTQHVKGIYASADIPKLIVVDKFNGGKADALNVGINVASKEYICSIDSDSILEEDALLKLVSSVLDKDVETPALGGNVFPINGCKVDFGVVKEKHVPKSIAGKFQTVEYIRAFMAGRLGWAYINNLLIISGAFGLFRKERGIDVGGYLTSSGQYGKDTVGEDMEIVVRISRRMREMKKKYRICYAYNANCWTEVPEDFKSLKKQRYRWQRGLIELMYFHRRMIFNIKYGSTGFLSMPYYFIFEIMGPIFEIQGYIAIVLAIILGVMYWDIAILLFVSVIMTGTLVSIASLIIAEQSGRIFGAKDTSKLLFCAFFENFGMRQYFSLMRFRGYMNVFVSEGGWEKAERKGFSS